MDMSFLARLNSKVKAKDAVFTDADIEIGTLAKALPASSFVVIPALEGFDVLSVPLENNDRTKKNQNSNFWQDPTFRENLIQALKKRLSVSFLSLAKLHPAT